MPELPEVETIRRQLEPELTGLRIVDAWTFGTTKFLDAPAAIGHQIMGARRRGKYLIFDLDGAKELIIHLGMTGRLGIEDQPGHDEGEADDSASPAPFVVQERPAHRRAEWLLDDGRILMFTDIRRFGRLAVVNRGEHSSMPTLAALGPEPFDDDFSPEYLWQSLRRSRQPIKTQLLSQRIVAGLGNIYVDEALWIAGVHPTSRRITKIQAATLRDAIRVALDTGLANGGTTLRDYRDAVGASGSNQTQLRCYGRAGLPCLRCGHVVSKIVVGGRTTSFCPMCQPRR